jgi:hypothetical protein
VIIALFGAAVAAAADPMGVAVGLGESCGAGDPNQIVVCGSREKNQRYRLPKLPDNYDARTIRAETKIAGIPAGIRINSVDLAGGQKSNRVMLTIATSF